MSGGAPLQSSCSYSYYLNFAPDRRIAPSPPAPLPRQGARGEEKIELTPSPPWGEGGRRPGEGSCRRSAAFQQSGLISVQNSGTTFAMPQAEEEYEQERECETPRMPKSREQRLLVNFSSRRPKPDGCNTKKGYIIG